MAQKIAVSIRKGGAGKSSTAVGIGSTLAASGRKTLLVDLDPQGTLTDSDVGLSAVSDHGANLAKVLQFGGEVLTPISSAAGGKESALRDNLDVVAGGRHLLATSAVISSMPDGELQMANNLGVAIDEVVAREGYQFVIFDTPPVVSNAVLMVADWLLIPCPEDDGSIRGIPQLASQFMRAKQMGSPVELLGVVLFNMSRTAVSRNQATRAKIEQYLTVEDGDLSPVYESMVGHSKAVAVDLRERSLLPPELVPAVEDLQRETFKRLRDNVRVSDRMHSGSNRSVSGMSAAEQINQDYQEITKESIRRITTIREEARQS